MQSTFRRLVEKKERRTRRITKKKKKKKKNLFSKRTFKGLQKIAEASMTLNELNEILAVQRVKVADQTRNCEQLLASIGESTDIAMEKKQFSEKERQAIEVQRKIINKEETEAKEALAEAQPALDAARLALGELDKADITEIRSVTFLSFFLSFYETRIIK